MTGAKTLCSKSAAHLRERFAEHDGAARGNAGRLVVSAKIHAEAEQEAERWARHEVYSAVARLLRH